MNKPGPVNTIDKLPRGYILFEGKDLYREGDVLEIDKDVKWVKLSGASFLVRKKIEITHNVPVYRKGKK